MKLKSTWTGVIAVSAVLALAGCTAIAGHGDGGGASASPSARTYSAAALSRVLERTAAKLDVDGDIHGDGEIKDAVGKLGAAAGLTELLGDANVTYSPSSCGTLVAEALAGETPKGAISALLTAGYSTVTVASLDGESLTEAQKAAWNAPASRALGECGKMSVSFDLHGVTTTAVVTAKKVAVHTAADSASGFEQTVSFALDGASVSAVTTVVEAVSGNLLVVASHTRTNQATEFDDPAASPSATDAVNAVIASAG